MANVTYNDSSYRFTEPVRFFKSNDPYYYEVDNIPLKQLQENCLWLKDQLGIGAGGSQGKTGITSVNRADFNELKPYANGGDRIVRVKPGRYSARINNVSEKEKLQYLQQVLGKGTGSPYAGEVGVGDEYEGAVQNTTAGNLPNATLETTLNKFKATIKENSLGMGGLEERAFTWPVQSSKWPFDGSGIDVFTHTKGSKTYYGGGGVPAGPGDLNYIWNVPMPIHQALMWARQADGVETPVNDLLYNWRHQSSGFGQLPYNESYWVKRWRGITKISIVDIPEELAIWVPTWDSDDFFYIDEDSNKIQIDGAAARIDLVFIYSKPIDASGITIWKQGYPQKINTPELGIVRGAGIGVPFNDYDGAEGGSPVKITINDGSPPKMKPWGIAGGANPRILPSVGDQAQDATNFGFLSTSANDIAQDVVGSFPSPDDILNLAPLISNQLEENAVELVGQSILPVAYIFVQNNGSIVVSPEDVIDIRPFFRTTELAYNERAGIAAAMPQLSLANPAVGKAELTQALGELKQDLSVGNFPGGGGITQENSNTNMHLLAAGQVYGGWHYGVEGALLDFEGRYVSNGGDTLTQLKNAVCATYGYPINTNNAGASYYDVPVYPDWDIAPWCETKFSSEVGQHVNDRINTFTPWSWSEGVVDNSIKGGSYRKTVLANGTYTNGNIADELGSTIKEDHGQLNTFENAENPGNSFNFISKIFTFNRPVGMYDYQVDVTLLNCLPLSYAGVRSVVSTSLADAGAASYGGNIWVEKGYNYFVIYISTSINKDIIDVNKLNSTKTGQIAINKTSLPLNNRNNGRLYSNFFVSTKSIINESRQTKPLSNEDGWQAQPGIGMCTYPSVTWKMTGIPAPRPNNYNTAVGSSSFKSFEQETGTNITLYS